LRMLVPCHGRVSSRGYPRPRVAFAPGGTLRASINLGNPVLATTDPVSGEPAGVSVDLASSSRGRLGAGIDS